MGQGRRGNGRRPHAFRGPAEGGEWIYGRRPALEALRARRRRFYEALLPPEEGRDAPDLAEIRYLIRKDNVPAKICGRDALDNLCRGGNHQGVALRVSGFPYLPFADVLAEIEKDPQATLLLLDHIEDPQNVGSLLRTANAAGMTAVILPEDRSAGVTPAAVRVSAGAAEHMRVAKVVNLTRALAALKERQVWITGLEADPSARPYTAIDFSGRVGLVIGSESRGLSRLVRETCDFIACLPMRGGVASLNAGVAGGIAIYEILRQRLGR